MTHRIACLIAVAAVLSACGGSDDKRESAAATATPTATPTPIIEKVRGNPTPMPEITPSGNSVTVEDEMMKVSSNDMDYQTATALYTRSIRLIRLALGKEV